MNVCKDLHFIGSLNDFSYNTNKSKLKNSSDYVSCLQREGCGEALVPRGDDPALRGQPQDQAGAGGGGALPHRHQGGLRPRGASHPHHQVRARGDHPCPPRGVRAPLLVIAAI